MPRTTDDLQEGERFRPFGPKVEPKPAASKPPHTKPQGAYGVVTLPDGTMRTTRDNLPPRSALEEAIWSWKQTYADDYEMDFLP